MGAIVHDNMHCVVSLTLLMLKERALGGFLADLPAGALEWTEEAQSQVLLPPTPATEVREPPCMHTFDSVHGGL